MGNWLLSGMEVKYKDWVLKQEGELRRDSRGQWLIPTMTHPGHTIHSQRPIHGCGGAQLTRWTDVNVKEARV